ncbi:unnamed protein product, partial [Musa textilis]
MARESGRDGIDWLVLLGRGRQATLLRRKVSKRQGKREAGIATSFLFLCPPSSYG